MCYKIDGKKDSGLTDYINSIATGTREHFRFTTELIEPTKLRKLAMVTHF